MTLRLGYVAGVSPGRWLRTWNERRPDQRLEATRVDEAVQFDGLLAGEHDLAFVRLPVPHEGLHTIALWDEVAVVVLPKEHPLADAASVKLADLASEQPAPAQADAGLTVELVAAGTGYAIMPHGVARLHHRRDVVAIPLTDVPGTRIALVWRVERDDEDIQDFVGVVRGRTLRSSRGPETGEEPAGSAANAGSAKGSPGKPRTGTTGAGASRKPGARGAGNRKPAGKRSGKGRRR
jgi:DNA-binding transcriptional LysR family regulator